MLGRLRSTSATVWQKSQETPSVVMGRCKRIVARHERRGCVAPDTIALDRRLVRGSRHRRVERCPVGRLGRRSGVLRLRPVGVDRLVATGAVTRRGVRLGRPAARHRSLRTAPVATTRTKTASDPRRVTIGFMVPPGGLREYSSEGGNRTSGGRLLELHQAHLAAGTALRPTRAGPQPQLGSAGDRARDRVAQVHVDGRSLLVLGARDDACARQRRQAPTAGMTRKTASQRAATAGTERDRFVMARSS